jgi:hypothetical protein
MVVAVAHGLVEDLIMSMSWPSYLEMTKCPTLMACAWAKRLQAVVEEYLPFVVEHHLQGPHAGRIGEHTQYDVMGLLPVDD